MNELYDKSLHTLELDRILVLLADACTTEEGKTLARSLRPSSDADDVKLLLQFLCVDAIHHLAIMPMLWEKANAGGVVKCTSVMCKPHLNSTLVVLPCPLFPVKNKL